jgi:hypothetical protein
VRGELKYKLKRGGQGKPVVEGRTGASRSDDGTWAQVEQHIDRENKTKRKRVVLADGTVAKDYDGPIDGGHGDPRTWPENAGRGSLLGFIRRVTRR